MSISPEYLLSIFRSYSNALAEIQLYNWSDRFCKAEAKAAFDAMLNKIGEHFDFKNITVAEAEILGFRKWDTDGDLYLIPLYLAPIIPVGIELESINGNVIIYNGSNIDLDNRMGMLAFGIHISQTH